MKPLKLESWEITKPPYIRIISQSMAIAAQDLFDCLMEVKSNTILKHFEPLNLKSWLKLYRDRGRLFIFFLAKYLNLGGMPAIHAQAFLHITQSIPYDNETKANQQLLTVDDVNSIHYSFIRDEILDKPLAEDKIDFLKSTFFNHDFLFLMKIIFPIWLLTGKNYILLYRKATQGDVQSLEDLLRFDKFQIQNPRINKWIYFYSCKRNKKKFSTLLEGIHGQPRSKITLRKVKYLISGYISVFSEMLGHRLSAPEIQSLFDAVAIDYGIDDLRDPDLPDSPESFSKAVQREREFWLTAFSSNRTKLFSEMSGSR